MGYANVENNIYVQHFQPDVVYVLHIDCGDFFRLFTKTTYISSSGWFSMSSRFGISNISTLSEKDILGVLLPDDCTERDVSDVGVCGVVVNSTILSVDTEGVSVIDSGDCCVSFLASLRRCNVSLYSRGQSISSSPLQMVYSV